MSVFRLAMLRAGDGDCLMLTWGAEGALHHIVIDGGRAAAYYDLKPMLASMARNGEPLELFVLTHIDADHIAGALSFIKDEQLPVEPRQVWFNGYDQMNTLQALGEKQGDEYSIALADREWPQNSSFANGVASRENASGVIDVAGLKITILSPDGEHLRGMRDRWADWRTEQAARETRRREAREAVAASELVALGRSPMPTPLVVEDLAKPGRIDHEAPNGSSIGFIAEWCGRRVLLAGDAHPDVLTTAIRPLAEAEGGRYRIDVLKVSHHGSQGNTTPELVKLLDCHRFAFSTNGNVHGHPDPEAIARILVHGPSGRKELIFNYDPKEQTRPWDAAELKQQWDYTCVWPPKAPGVQVIDLMADGEDRNKPQSGGHASAAG